MFSDFFICKLIYENDDNHDNGQTKYCDIDALQHSCNVSKM